MPTFDAAVVLTTFNRVTYLTQTIDSVLAQKFDGRIELVIVDDGSTDNTAQVMETFTKRYADAMLPVSVRYLPKKNEGLAIARNHGIANTTAPFIAFLDDDDLADANKVARQVKELASDTAVGLCHTSFRYIDKDGKLIDDGPQRVENPCRGKCVDALLNELVVVSSTVMVRRETLMKAAKAEPHGLPYDSAWVRSQDYDMALRMSRLSSFAYIQDPLLLYRLHGGNIAMTDGNIKKAYGYHCRVQIDFVRRYGKELGLTHDDAIKRVSNFLYARANSFFWQRRFKIARQMCELAGELQARDARFEEIERKTTRPEWVYRVKDKLDKMVGR